MSENYDTDLIEKFVEACRQEAALALKVDLARITAFGEKQDDKEGSILILWRIDGQDPSQDQIKVVENHIQNIIVKATTN